MIRMVASIVPTFLFSVLLSAAAPKASSSQEAQGDVIRSIMRMEEASKQAAIRRDVEFAERTLADNYIAISPLGTIISKNETLIARKNSQVKYDSIDLSEMVVRVFGNTAVVTGRADVKGKDLGEDFSGPYRFTRVWVKRNGQWQAVSYQATVTH